MAGTTHQDPIRVWTSPCNTNDTQLIQQVRDDLRSWKLSRVVCVADSAFSSAENRGYLRRAGGHYVVGEKLRAGAKQAQAALSRPGRDHTLAGNLRVKEVVMAFMSRQPCSTWRTVRGGRGCAKMSSRRCPWRRRWRVWSLPFCSDQARHCLLSDGLTHLSPAMTVDSG